MEPEIPSTPPRVLETARTVMLNLLPEKSREVYESAYNRFMKWCNENDVNKYSENVLLGYFATLSPKMKCSTLWSQYSMLKATLNLRKNVDIDRYNNLKAYLKRQSVGYKPKKSRVLTKEQINTFLVDAPDNKYLMTKVGLIFGVAGACRCDELVKLKISDIDDVNLALLVKIPNTKTNKPRSFTVLGDRNLNLYRKYVALRPKYYDEQRFFIKYQNGMCHKMVSGLHKLSSIAQDVAKYLNLENASQYTGHCLRRTSATLLVDSGGDLTCLKRHGGWKSGSVAEGYIEESVSNKNDIASKILLDQKPNHNEKENYPTHSRAEEPSGSSIDVPCADFQHTSVPINLNLDCSQSPADVDVNMKKLNCVERSGLFNFLNSSNCTFNINIKN